MLGVVVAVCVVRRRSQTTSDPSPASTARIAPRRGCWPTRTPDRMQVTGSSSARCGLDVHCVSDGVLVRWCWCDRAICRGRAGIVIAVLRLLNVAAQHSEGARADAHWREAVRVQPLRLPRAEAGHADTARAVPQRRGQALRLSLLHLPRKVRHGVLRGVGFAVVARSGRLWPLGDLCHRLLGCEQHDCGSHAVF